MLCRHLNKWQRSVEWLADQQLNWIDAIPTFLNKEFGTYKYGNPLWRWRNRVNTFKEEKIYEPARFASKFARWTGARTSWRWRIRWRFVGSSKKIKAKIQGAR